MKRKYYIVFLILAVAVTITFIINLIMFISWVSSWVDTFSRVEETEFIMDAFYSYAPHYISSIIFSTVAFLFTWYFGIFVVRHFKWSEFMADYKAKKERISAEKSEAKKQQKIAELKKQIEELEKDDQ